MVLHRHEHGAIRGLRSEQGRCLALNAAKRTCRPLRLERASAHIIGVSRAPSGIRGRAERAKPHERRRVSLRH